MIRLIMSLLLLLSHSLMADAAQDDDVVLAEVVSNTIRIMRDSGYAMPDYRVMDGGTDLPISGPPERGAFFGYLKAELLTGRRTLVLHFYEADRLPADGRAKLVAYLVSLHAERQGDFSLTLCMMKDRYRKGQLVLPAVLLEMELNRIEE